MTHSPLETTTLGDIAARDYRAVEILDRYRLDYCCGGARSLADGCQQAGIDVERVVSEITALDGDERKTSDMDPAALIDQIVARHHTYIRVTTPLIQQHLSKVLARHGSRHAEVAAIASQFDTISSELRLHMLKEEQVLFPYIKGLAAALNGDGAPPPDMFGTVQNPIRMMEIEHQEAGDGMAAIRVLSNGYVPPADGCHTYRLVFQELEAFEKDLHHHVHLENNVLFPKAVELEEKVELKARGLKSQRWEAGVLND